MELKELQQQFYQVLQQPDLANKNNLNLLIKAPNNLTPDQGIEIYKNSIHGQLHRVIQEIYPVSLQLVGEKFFHFTVTHYINSFPSISPDLGDYGANLAEFLEDFEQVSQLPYLPDIARLEWGYHRVFNGEKEDYLDFKELAKVPQSQWNNIIFHLPKNRVLLESNYPIHRIWEVNQPDYKGDKVVNLNEGSSHILLWRKDYQMRLDLPNKEQWKFIKYLANNQPLEVICSQLEDGASLLSEVVQQGWVTSFSFSEK